MAQVEPNATRIVYERKDGSWGWQLRAADGVVLATNGAKHVATEKEARALADRVIGGTYKDCARRVRRRPDADLSPAV